MKSKIPRSRAWLASAGLSALFLMVYGFTNWLTARRIGVGSLYFEWEHAIPFVPLLIPAYLSLDLFFIGAPFLCRSQEELRSYTVRIALAILVAGLCFLLFPLRFAFARPPADGFVGALFDGFRTLDAPFNLAPSLHAALLLLVADVYLRHLNGIPKALALGWFGLIGLSPILTYQHHVIDIGTGFILAAYCFYFVPVRGMERQAERLAYNLAANRRANHGIRIASYYAAGAIGLVAAALVLRSWAVLLLWPAMALGIVAAAYLGRGPFVFRKSDGRIPWSTRFVLGPYLLGQHLSIAYYQRHCRPWDVVTSRVWIGRKLSHQLAKQAVRSGVTAVLDLTAEFSEPAAFRQIRYHNIPVLDLTAPTQNQLTDMGRFILEQERRGIVYVHCKIGYSRSAAAIAAYLLMTGQAATASEAFSLIRRVRPTAVIRPEIISALQLFETELRQSAPAARSFLLASTEPALA